MNADLINIVFSLARLGLGEVAKDTRNGPAVVANHAAALEQWRAECEKALAPKPPDQAADALHG